MENNYCHNCGGKIVKNTNFCASCGASLAKKNKDKNEAVAGSTEKGKNKNTNRSISTKEGRYGLVSDIKRKAKENKLKTGIILIGFLFVSFFIFLPSPQAVADKFIEYSAYDEREKALPLMSEEGKDYMMGMTREEFEAHPDYAPYETVLRTRISRLTHNRASQFREMVSYQLIAEEKYEGGVLLTYQTIFSNGDTETPWIHLVKERGRWKVYSFYENSYYY